MIKIPSLKMTLKAIKKKWGIQHVASGSLDCAEDMNEFERLLFDKHTHADLCNPEEVVYRHSDLQEIIDVAVKVALQNINK